MPIIFQPECGPKCRSKKHCLEVNSVVTKGSLRDLQAYSLLCHTWAQHTDTAGRAALHVAASCGKLDVVEWLLEEKHQDTSCKDKESGWTALHRALFYGQLSTARLLVQFSADLYTRDHEGLGPMDILMKDRPQHLSFDIRDANEVYSWGDNSNLTLGHASEHRRPVPEAVDTFRRLGVSVKQIVMSKYHTVFLAQSGLVYTCGHGHGGRLGHGDERTCVIPKIVETLVKDVCIQIAAARDHTLFLTDKNCVYCCGLNDCHQLGVATTGEKGTTKYLVPTKMNLKALKGKNILGVCAGRYHSVVYTAGGLFTCGLNAGQLGHPKGEKHQSQVRMVTQLSLKDTVVSKVASSDAAVVCFTGRGDLFLLHDYVIRRIGSRWLDIDKLLVCGGDLDHSADVDILSEKGGFEVKVVLLNSSGKLFMWRSSSPNIKRCHFAIRRQVIVKDVGLNMSGLVIVTDLGEAFTGYLSGKKLAMPHKDAGKESADKELEFGKISLIDLMLKDDVEEISLRRTPCVHRATSLACDLKGHNFAVTQALPNGWLTDVPCVSESTIQTEYRQLMEEADLFDAIHDCVVQVENHKWPAHMFILASRADYFRKQIPGMTTGSLLHGGEKPVFALSDIQPDVVEQLLKFIYTDSCDLFNIGAKFSFSQPDKNSLKNSNNNNNTSAQEDGTLFDGKTISAFEVALTDVTLSGAKKGDKKGSRNKGGDPVKIMQETARRFGVRGLSRRLEAVKCVNGILQSSGQKFLPSCIRYERNKLIELYDACIQAEDGTTFKCHKCVLVARLEYYHSMLGSGWIETSDTESLSLPIPGNVLEILLDYVYQDESAVVSEIQDLELLCNVLVVADQLLVTRLREMCEVALTSQMSLRNVGELLEIALAYNAPQLRQACHQFIFLNLPALLESRNLDMLSDRTMQDLTDSYRQAVGRMSSRVITPWSEGPDTEFLASLTSDFDAESTPKPRDTSAKKLKSKRRQGQSKSLSEDVTSSGGAGHVGSGSVASVERQISVGSDVSGRSDDEGDLEKTDKSSASSLILTAAADHSPVSSLIQKVKAKRWLPFSAIAASGGALQSELLPPQASADMTSLASASQPIPIKASSRAPLPLAESACASVPSRLGKSSNLDMSLPSISLRNIMQEQQDVKVIKPKSSGKFSWKEVKKQQNKATQAQKTACREESSNSVPVTPTPPTPSASVVCPWGSVNKVVQSFRDLMQQEDKSNQRKPQMLQPHQQPPSRQTLQPQNTLQPTAQNRPKPQLAPPQLKSHPPATPTGSSTSPTSAQPGQVASDGLTSPVEKKSSSRQSSAANLCGKSPPATQSFSWGLPVRISSTPQPIPGIPSPPPPTLCAASSPSDNPWQRWTAASPPGCASPNISFSDIVQDELHQKVSLEKASQKPLHFIQMEEEAISQLSAHYRVKECTEEYITVERVTGPVAAPLWKHKRKTASSHS